MKIATECQFCHMPITVEIDDEYGKMGDPHKLMRLRCCNHYSDVRTGLRRVRAILQKQCYSIQLLKSSGSEVPAKARNNLIRMTQASAKLIAQWHKMEGMAWEEAIVDTILENPHMWSDVVSKMWSMAKHHGVRPQLIEEQV